MRIPALWFLPCFAACVVAGPADAKVPPPLVASHGEELRAARVDYCPRPERRPCHLVDEFRRAGPLTFHPGGRLTIRAERRADRFRLNLDCSHTKPVSDGARRWRVQILGDECTQAILDLFYPRRDRRPLRVRYTFNLRNHGHCEGDGYATRGENYFVRIYSLWSPDDYEPEIPENEYFACRLDSGSTYRLGRSFSGDAYSGDDFLGPLALAGEKVAYVSGHYSGRYGPDRRSTLTVLDSNGWQIEREITESEGHPALRREFTALALKANGSVAWILNREDYTGGPEYSSQTYEVWKADKSGRARLDSSPDIRYWWLTLTGSVLHWRLENGEPRSATLE